MKPSSRLSMPSFLHRIPHSAADYHPRSGRGPRIDFGRIPNAQRQIVFFSLLITAVVNAVLILIADFEGIQTLQIGGWDAPVGITLVADRLSAVMLFTSSVVLFSVIWYAISQGVRDGTKDEPVAVFLPTYMLLTMGVNISFWPAISSTSTWDSRSSSWRPMCC